MPALAQEDLMAKSTAAIRADTQEPMVCMTCMGLFLSSSRFGLFPVLCGSLQRRYVVDSKKGVVRLMETDLPPASALAR
jgi:hypothetical protein